MKTDTTAKARQDRFKINHPDLVKIQIPRGLRDVINTTAKSLGITPVMLIQRCLNTDIEPFCTTSDTLDSVALCTTPDTQEPAPLCTTLDSLDSVALGTTLEDQEPALTERVTPCVTEQTTKEKVLAIAGGELTKGISSVIVKTLFAGDFTIAAQQVRSFKEGQPAEIKAVLATIANRIDGSKPKLKK